jgi:hypothetical protein
MRITLISFIGLTLVMAGCQSTPQDPEVWVRLDGQRITGSPILEQQSEVDKAICAGQTQQAAVGMAPVYYSGLAGAISAAAISNQRSAALTDVAKGCMAQRGYMRVPLSQAEEARARFAANAKKTGSVNRKP